MTQPMDYYTQSTHNPEDLTHLKVLSICHWVWGGIIAVVSCVFIIHIGMGVFMLSAVPAPAPAAGTITLQATPTQPIAAAVGTTIPATRPAPVVLQTTPNAAPPAALGWFFILLGGCFMLLGWVSAALNFMSAYGMTRGKFRTLSFIAAGLNCLSIPIGTTLAIFTFIVLLRPSVSAMYAQRP